MHLKDWEQENNLLYKGHKKILKDEQEKPKREQMASSLVLNIPILFLCCLFITCSFVAPAPERYTIDIYNEISVENRLHLECDLNGKQYVPITLTQGTSETFTVDVDLPKPGGNYVLTCFADYGYGKYYGASWVLFDYQRDKSRCANKKCSWQINENGAFLLLRFYEWIEWI